MGKMRASVRTVAISVFAVVLLSAVAPQPASAEGIFEQFFGGIRRALTSRQAPPSSASAFSDPFASLASAPSRSADAGPITGTRGFCVRSCDGHYFPAQAQTNASIAETCQSYCPAAETRVYYGGSIDSAQARDGGRYADMPNAFLFRKQVVNGCSCNGKSPFGLARVDVKADPTLRPGDIVATQGGLVAYNGRDNARTADFTPVQNYSGMSKTARDQLSTVRMQPGPQARGDTSASITPAVAKNDVPRSASLR